MCSLFLPCFCPFHPGAQMLLNVTRISCLHFYCTFKTVQGKAAAKNLNGKGTTTCMKLDAERDRQTDRDKEGKREKQRLKETERERQRDLYRNCIKFRSR